MAPEAGAPVGELVQKTGRTTSYTVGRVISISTTVDINYREAGNGRFRDQIIATNMRRAATRAHSS